MGGRDGDCGPIARPHGMAYRTLEVASEPCVQIWYKSDSGEFGIQPSCGGRLVEVTGFFSRVGCDLVGMLTC